MQPNYRRIANDEMAELVAKYPDRFVSAIAALPLNDIDANLREVDRAIIDYISWMTDNLALAVFDELIRFNQYQDLVVARIASTILA